MPLSAGRNAHSSRPVLTRVDLIADDAGLLPASRAMSSVPPFRRACPTVAVPVGRDTVTLSKVDSEVRSSVLVPSRKRRAARVCLRKARIA